MDQEPSGPPPQERPLQQIDIARLSKLTDEYKERFSTLDIIDDAKALNIQIPNRYAYHKHHAVSMWDDGVFHEILFFALCDREYAQQFPTNTGDDHFLELCAIAAAYHDTGYTNEDGDDLGSRGHEARGAEHARRAMQEFNYSEEDIELVTNAITDTQAIKTEDGIETIKHPSNNIAAFLMDADTSNFGRADNSYQTGLIAEELGLEPNDPTLLSSTLHLMKTHEWHTQAARTLRQEQKEKNIKALEERIQNTQE